ASRTRSEKVSPAPIDELQAVRKNRRYEQVAEQIQGLIARGVLKAGDRLPPERELVSKFGVGRGSIRDAIRTVEVMGIVERRRGEPGIEEDSEFHYAIAVAARNTVVLRVLDVLMDLLRESRTRSLQSPGRLERSFAGHLRVLRAIKRGDPAGAERAVRQHLTE